MSELQDLVPPLDLCKKIPEGKFADSALIWFFDGRNWWVNAREFDSQPDYEYPAPTLPEIMRSLSRYCEPVIVTQWRSGQVSVVIQEDGTECEEISEDPATAALKLWLELEGGK